MLRIGLIGAGLIGSTHAMVLRQMASHEETVDTAWASG